MATSETDCTLPNNWCLCHFGDIATVINGKNQSKVENPNGKYLIYGSGGIMGRADAFICPENCTIIGRKGTGILFLHNLCKIIWKWGNANLFVIVGTAFVKSCSHQLI